MNILWLYNRMCHTYLMLNLQGKQNGDIITFPQFEEENLLTETCDNKVGRKKYYDNLTMPTLTS